MKRMVVIIMAVAVATLIGGIAGALDQDVDQDIMMDASLKERIHEMRAKPMELVIDGSFNAGDVDFRRLILKMKYVDGSTVRVYSDRKGAGDMFMWDKDLEVFLLDGAPMIDCLVEGPSRLMDRDFLCEGEYRIYMLEGRHGDRKLVASGVFGEGEGITLPEKPYRRLFLELDGSIHEELRALDMRRGVEKHFQGR